MHSILLVLLISEVVMMAAFNPSRFGMKRNVQQPRIRLNMQLGGLAEKLGGIVEFISGQSTITENNIEDTLKVIFEL